LLAFQTLDAAFDSARTTNASITLVDARGTRKETTATALWNDAMSALAGLRKTGLARGRRAILFIEDEYLFLVYFWACVLGGIVPAPLTVSRTAGARQKLLGVCGHLFPSVILVERDTKDEVEQWLQDSPKPAGLLVVNEHCVLEPPAVEREHLAPDDLAFIQFSSGSTGDPKGVMLTHGNLIANIEAIATGIKLTGNDRAVSWLPLSHDMGLIGFHLTPLIWNVPHTIMSPRLFFRAPMRWIECLSSERATISGSPSFGLRHVLRALRRSLPVTADLSDLRLLFNGAEPVSWPLCQAFLGAFSALGLRGEAMFPVYGLAEATLAVTFPKLGQPMKAIWLHKSSSIGNDRIVPASPDDPEAVPVVSVGAAVANCQISILDEDGKRKDDGHVGSIYVSGASVSRAYLGDSSAHASLRDTGDVGVILDGDLYVLGRRKDIYIRDGSKYHLSDIDVVCDRAVEDENLTVACAVVGPSIRNQEEWLIAFVEDKRSTLDLKIISAALNRATYRYFALKLDDVIPVPKLPRTTSGKIQRQELVDWWQKRHVKQA
jgi:acyl-CoA synthetase (AMP-forming)/AMP-acid ligase II